MTVSRRRYVMGAGAVALTTGSAGCIGDDEHEFDVSPSIEYRADSETVYVAISVTHTNGTDSIFSPHKQFKVRGELVDSEGVSLSEAELEPFTSSEGDGHRFVFTFEDFKTIPSNYDTLASGHVDIQVWKTGVLTQSNLVFEERYSYDSKSAQDS